MSPEPRPVELRRFPYPYRAALAICSDIDDCTLEVFRQAHYLLNERLGLPVADSFFGRGRTRGQMAYFEDDYKTPSEAAPVIRRAIQAGLIDSLHTWGDFNEVPPDPDRMRQMAERLCGELDKYGLPIKVWINHGDPFNYQNFKSRAAPTYQGDDPDSPYYTLDLVRQMGVKYFWLSEAFRFPLSGRLTVGSPRIWARLAEPLLRNVVRYVRRRRVNIMYPWEPLHLIRPESLRDGRLVLRFNRFNYGPDFWGPTRHTIGHAICPQTLDRLASEEGYAILYAHLGVPMEVEGGLFPQQDWQALADLARRYHEGAIWVTPTARLLDYRLAVEYLDWEVRDTQGISRINIVSLQDPVQGPRLPTEEELAGLCFYVPEARRAEIRIGDRETSFLRFPKDRTGRESIGLAPAAAPDFRSLEA